MRRTFDLALAVAGVLTLSAAVAVAGASTKFSYTETATDTGSLIVTFDEGSLKRFASVQYRLDATATAFWDLGNGQGIGLLTTPTANVTMPTDGKGHTSGTLTLEVGQPGGGCLCGMLQHVAYTDVRLTNLTTGHVYHLDAISRDYATP